MAVAFQGSGWVEPGNNSSFIRAAGGREISVLSGNVMTFLLHTAPFHATS